MPSLFCCFDQMDSSKRKRESVPTPDDFMLIGKEVQNKSGRSLGAPMSEDRAFRDFFGTSAIVAMIVWNLMVEHQLLPEGGTIIHFLWTLFFFKVYPLQGPACSAAGGSNGAVDPKTWRKYIWPFVYAVASLESIVVSSSASTCSFHLIKWWLDIMLRLFLRTGNVVAVRMMLFWVLMALMSESQTTDLGLHLTNLKESLLSGMSLGLTFWRVIWLGWTAHSLRGNGQISKYFAIVLLLGSTWESVLKQMMAMLVKLHGK